MKEKKPPHIFRSPLSGNWYYSTDYEDLGEGNFVANDKVDVSDQINDIINNIVTQCPGCGSAVEIEAEGLQEVPND